PSLARVLLRPPPPPAAPALHSFPPRCSSALPPRPCLVRRPAPTLPRPSSVSPSVSEGPVVMWPARTPERRVELRMSGRSGALVYVEGAREAAVYVEVSGVPEYDLLVWADRLGRWSTGEALTEAERARALDAYRAWARREGVTCQW